VYKVERIKIHGFWGRTTASSQFNDEVNVIIGRNGTGKTTFMNILHSILTVDLNGLYENDFDEVEIKLRKGGSKKSIRVKKIYSESDPYPVVEFKISTKKTTIRSFPPSDRQVGLARKRRYLQESMEIRRILDDLIPVSSLSVYRLRNDDEYEVRDRNGARVISPVDYRLDQALSGLANYFYKLSRMANEISNDLQTDVLASILFNKDDKDIMHLPESFDKGVELRNLISSYKQLNSYNSDIDKKIKFHVNSVEKSIDQVERFRNDKVEQNEELNLKPIEAYYQTKKVIDLSLDAKNKTKEIYSSIDTFIEILEGFITDKKFSFEGPRLIIKNEHGIINHSRLSSGEKQLIILLVEALLQNKTHHLFLADEPELSLHISWQRMIIPSIQRINPNAQVIVATHSPEVASKYRGYILNMEDIIHG